MSEASATCAATLASDLLHRELPDRYAHVASVAARARDVCQMLAFHDHAVLAAAWLHDIGYAPGVAETGFHPLDGARFLAERDFEPAITSLVAYHSSAATEAQLRGLFDEVTLDFPPPDAEAHELLTYCDMTSGRRGERLTVDERFADIFARYEPHDVVHRATRQAEDELRAIVARVDSRLAVSPNRVAARR